MSIVRTKYNDVAEGSERKIPQQLEEVSLVDQ